MFSAAGSRGISATKASLVRLRQPQTNTFSLHSFTFAIVGHAVIMRLRASVLDINGRLHLVDAHLFWMASMRIPNRWVLCRFSPNNKIYKPGFSTNSFLSKLHIGRLPSLLKQSRISRFGLHICASFELSYR